MRSRLLALAVCATLAAVMLGGPATTRGKGGVYTQTRHADPAAGAFRTAEWPRGDCAQCHAMHGGPAPNAFALFAPNTNGLCATSGCHAGTSTVGAYQGPVVYDATTHATRSSMVWPGPDATLDPAAPPTRPGGDWGKCVNCHDVHGYNMDGTGLIPSLTVSREEKLCHVCHDGSPADKNVKAEFAKPYRHPVATSGKHSVGEGGNPGAYAASPVNNRHAECEDCHNPHVANAANRLGGLGRVAVTNGPAGSVPVYTYRSPADTTAPIAEYQVCFKCHSSWTTRPGGQTDLAERFNSNNPSYHPVEAVGKNLAINASAFVSGWSASAQMTCTDCHTSDNTSIRGPHGSQHRYILKKSATASSARRTMSSTELCFDCHGYDTYANDNASDAVKGYSRFNPPQHKEGHAFHVGDKRYPCYACHDSHASTTQPHLIVIGRNPGITSYTQTSNGGSCTATCHEPKSYTINYPR
jgi:predicted CXXCH cytochrome family protein